MKPQCRQILRLLERGPVSAQDAIREASCYRLAARVADLKALGYRIDSELVTEHGSRFAVYHLVTEPVQLQAFG